MSAPTQWREWTSVVLGFYLLLVPLLNGDSATALTVLVAEVGGLLVIGAAIRTLMRPGSTMARWTQVVVGALLVLSPVALGFVELTGAAWNAYLVGGAVAALALSTFVPSREDAASSRDRESVRAG